MVYYNPYNKLFYAIKNAIKAFINSLFSKRTLLIIIVCLFIILFHQNVFAESVYVDGYAYRKVEKNEDDSISYRIYNSGGMYEGTFLLPSIEGLNNYIIYVDNGGTLRLVGNMQNYNVLYVNCLHDGAFLCWQGQSYSANYLLVKAYYYYYDFSNNTWNSVYEGVNAKITSSYGKLVEPSSIVFSNEMYVEYTSYQDSNITTNAVMLNDRTLKTPELSYITDVGFRLYLKDFFGSTTVKESYELYDSLFLYFSAYNFKNSTYTTDLFDLLSYRDVEIDDEGNYYIDLLFEDLLEYMYGGVEDGDYLLFFGSYLSSVKHVNDLSSCLDYTTKYASYDYFRFKYFASSRYRYSY